MLVREYICINKYMIRGEFLKKKVDKKNVKAIEPDKGKELEKEIEIRILTDLQKGDQLEISRYIPQYDNDLVMNILHSLEKDKGCIENIKFAVGGGKISIYDNKAKITYRGEIYLGKLQQ